MFKMAKTFNKDPNRKRNNDIPETNISEPTETFSLHEFQINQNSNVSPETKPVGRPRKNKIYSTIRVQRETVHRINALQNTLVYETQDDLVTSLLNRLETSLDPEQRIMYEMYMKAYTSRDERNK